MKASFLTSLVNSVGGLGLTVGVLLWPTVSQAQGFCYMINSDGRVINLDDLCASGGAFQAMPPQGETTNQDEATAADIVQPGAASSERGFTIIGSPTNADPSEAAADSPRGSVDTESTGNESRDNEFNESRDNESRDNEFNESRDNESLGEESRNEEPRGSQDRPGIPVERITIPNIEVPQIQTPAEPDSFTSDPDTNDSETNDSETNGNVINNSN